MAKSKNEFEEFLDDKFSHEFDSFANLDTESFGNSEPLKEDRNPAHKFTSGALREFKDSEYSMKNIKRLVRRAAPSGYVAAYDLADDYSDRLSGIYDKVQKELEPSKKILKEVARKNVSKIDKLLPKSLAEKVKRSLEEEPDKGQRQEVDYDNELIINSLKDIFGGIQDSNTQDTEQSIKNTEIDLKLRAKESEMNSTQNSSIIKGINTLVSFQNNILFKYYRKSLELQYRQTFYLRDLYNYHRASQTEQIAQLTAIVKNTGLPEETKVQMLEALGKQNKLKLAGAAQTHIIDKLRNYPKQIWGNIERKAVDWGKDLNSSIVTAQETRQQMREMGFNSEEEILGQMITDAISEGSANKLGDYLKNVIYKKFPELKVQSRKIENSILQHTRLINTNLTENQDTLSLKGKVLGFFKDIFGTVGTGDDESINHNLKSQATESAGFDLLSRRTLIEIIPGFQSRQLQELETITSGIQSLVKSQTGKTLDKSDRVVYSTKREEFISQKQAVEDTKAEVKSKISNNLASDVKYMLDVIDPDKKLDIDSRIELGMVLTSESNNGKYFSIPRLLKSEINSGPNSEKIMDFIKDRYGLDRDGKPLEGEDLQNEDGTDKEIVGDRTTDENRLINIFNRLVDNIGDIQSVVNSYNATGEKELLRLTNIVTKGKDKKTDVFNYAEKHKLIEDVLREGYIKLKTQEDEQALRDNPPPEPPQNEPPDDVESPPPDLPPDSGNGSGGNDETKEKDNPPDVPPDNIDDKSKKDKKTPPKQNDLLDGETDIIEDASKEDTTSNKKEKNEKQRDIFDEEVDLKTEERIDEITTEITESFEQSLKDMVERFTEEYEKTHKNKSKEKSSDLTFQELMDQLRSDKSNINSNKRKRTKINNSNEEDNDVEVLTEEDDLLTQYVFDIRELVKASSETSNKNITEILSILKDGKIQVNSNTTSIAGSITKDDIKELVESINKTLKDNLSELNTTLSQNITDIFSHFNGGGILGSLGRLGTKTKDVIKDTGKSIWKAGNWGFDKLVSGGKSGLGLASSIASWSFNKTLGKIKDIYVNDRPNDPIMTVSRLRAGEYIDSNTGKVIKELKDVTGEVRDKDGNLVLSFDDFNKGLHVRDGDIKTMFGSAWGALKSGAKAVFDINMFIPRTAIKVGKSIFNTVKDLYYSPKDVYVEGDTNPRLTSQGFKAGNYFSKLTGKKLNNHLEIDGAVTNSDGSQTIISQEEYQTKKLLLANGKEIDKRSLISKVIDKGLQFGKWLKKKGKESFDFITGLGKTVFDKITGFVSNTFNKLTGRFDFDNLPKDIIFSTNKTNTILTNIYTFLLRRFDNQNQYSDKINSKDTSSNLILDNNDKIKSNTLVDIHGNPLETSTQVKIERTTKKLKEKLVNAKDKFKEKLPSNIKERLKNKLTEKLNNLSESIDNVKDDDNKSLLDYLRPYKDKYTKKINKLKEIKLPTNLTDTGDLIGNYGLKAKKKIDSIKDTFKEVKEQGLVNSLKSKKEKLTAEGKLSMIASLSQILSLSKVQELFGKQFSNINNLETDIESGKSLRGIINRIKRIATLKDKEDTKLSVKDRILDMKNKLKEKLFNKNKSKEDDNSPDGKKGLLSKLFGGAKGALAAGATGLMSLFGKKDKPNDGSEEDKNGNESDGIIKGTLLASGLALGKSLLGKAGGLLGRAGGSILGRLGLGAAGRIAGGGLLRSGAGLALRGLGVAAGILTNPWILAAWGAYEGYKLLKDVQYNAKLEDLEKLRYLQYGIPINNEKAVYDIRKFEDTILEYFKIDDKFRVTFELSEDQLWDKITGFFGDIFGLDSDSKIDRQHFVIWFYKRFSPVVCQHMQACKKFGDIDLDDVDDDIKKEDIPGYVKAVQFGRDQLEVGVIPYAIMMSPWINIKLVDNTKLIKDLSNQLMYGKDYKEKLINNTSDIKSSKTEADKKASLNAELLAQKKREEEYQKKQLSTKGNTLLNINTNNQSNTSRSGSGSSGSTGKFIQDNNIQMSNNTTINNPYSNISFSKPKTYGAMMQEQMSSDNQGSATNRSYQSNQNVGFSNSISGLVTNPDGYAKGQPKITKLSNDKKSMMTNVYKAFKEAGFSHNQAKALTAEVGRENDFNPKTVFGSHTDYDNGATNIGFISWQGTRATALKKRLASKGLLDSSGKMIQSQESLNEMAKFARSEMESGQYKGIGDFMSNKNVDSETAAKQLGKGYVKWRYGKTSTSGGKPFDWHDADNKRAGYSAQIEELTSNGQVSTQTTSATTINTNNRSGSGGSGSTGKLPDNQLTGTESIKDKVKSSGSTKFITPAPGRISSPFGMRTHPVLKIKKMHTGIDIAAPMGTPVVATSSGVIAKAGTAGGYGNLIILDHDDGATSSRYAHLSRFADGISDGIVVKAGQTIAYVGSTGRSTGPHLHFEIRRGQGTGNNTTPIDPAPLLGGKVAEMAKEVGKENDKKTENKKGNNQVPDNPDPEVEPVNPNKATEGNNNNTNNQSTGNQPIENQSNNNSQGSNYTNPLGTNNQGSNNGLTPNSLVAGEPQLSTNGNIQGNTPFQNISNMINSNVMGAKNAINMAPNINQMINGNTQNNQLTTTNPISQSTFDLNPLITSQAQMSQQTVKSLDSQNQIMNETNNLLKQVIDSIKSLGGSIGNNTNSQPNSKQNSKEPVLETITPSEPVNNTRPNNPKEINPIISFRKQ